jgi:hypothetical protein
MTNQANPLDDAHRLLKKEAERAIAMFPDDEAEAISEVLRRSHSIPDLKRVLLIHGAYGAVAEALGTGRWMVRRPEGT